MHDCFQCGSACYCHGDIDDCQVETIEYAYDHCEGCGCDEDRYELEDEGLDEDLLPDDLTGIELDDFDRWREEYTSACVLHRNAHCSRCHA